MRSAERVLLVIHLGDMNTVQKKSVSESPHGGVIAGLVIGIVIILVGIASLLGIEFWNYLWPLAIIIIGVLIASGALYKHSLRY